jgi:hypothetical protein
MFELIVYFFNEGFYCCKQLEITIPVKIRIFEGSITRLKISRFPRKLEYLIQEELPMNKLK